MTVLLRHPLFRSLLVAASCMYDDNGPAYLSRANIRAADGTPPPSMVVTGDHTGRRHKSAKPKRRDRCSKSIVDSGATVHCIRDKSLFTHLDTSKHVNLRVADNRVIRSEGVGTCAVSLKSSDGNLHTVMLHNCLYSPSFSENLISTRRLWLDNKLSTHMGDTNYFKCHFENHRYYFNNDCTHDMQPAARRMEDDLDLEIIHARFNHCGKHRTRKMFDVTNGLGEYPKHSKQHDPHNCPACQEGALRRKAFAKHRTTKYTYFGERISSDLCGPFPKSVDGYTYALCFVDAYTNYCAIYLLKTKSSSEVKWSFQEFLKDHKEHLTHGKQVKWHTDNGGEFMAHDLDDFCNEFAIARSFSVPYAPPQNAQAERMWGILLKPVRALLAGARIDDAFWSYAMRHACQCHNVMPSYAQPNMRSPWEAITGKMPDVSKFRIWGCLAWYLAPDHEVESKVSPRAWPAVHLGFDPLRNGYMVYIPHKNRITTGFHISFQEHRFLKMTPTHISSLPSIPKLNKPLRKPMMLYKEPRDRRAIPPALPSPLHGGTTTTRTTLPPRDRGSDDSASENRTVEDGVHDSVDDRPTRIGTFGPPPPRATRNPNPDYVNVIIDDVVNASFSMKIDDTLANIPIPKTFAEADSSHLRKRWIVAMEREITDLLKNDTWELVSIDNVPRNRKVVKSRFVYTVKYNRDGTIERFKARFVACGYSQIQGFDYDATFSATLRSTSFRLLMAIAAGKKLTINHFDVTNAFTQSEIDAEIYVEAPPGGFTPYDDQGRPQVLKLKKALYGTKQASRLWQDKLVNHLTKKMGFKRLNYDPCLFIKHSNDASHDMIVGVYVDDVVVAHNSLAQLRWFMEEFTGRQGFRSKHLGKLSWFLGMAVDQHADHSITVHQTKYTEKLLDKFIPSHATSSKSHTMPCNPEIFQRLSTSHDTQEKERLTKLPYLELVGSLLYLSTMTRPDIAYHMSVLCSHMHNPSIACYNAAIDLLLYVGHTRHYNLRYDGTTTAPEGLRHASEINSTNCGFVAYSDSSWHKPDELGYNMFGYSVFMFGGPVAFAAKRLKVVAHSSAEAEYAASSYACKEVAFVRNVCVELGVGLHGPVCLAVDNEAAIKIAENRGVTGRTKHFSDAIHYVRHMLDHNIIKVHYVATNHQLADGFTKPLDKSKFRSWCRRLMSGVGEEYTT